MQHVEGRLAPRPQLALPAEDGLEMIGQGLTGPDVVLDALPDIAVRFLTFDAPAGQVLRLVDLQAQQTAAPVPRAGKAQQVLAALALLPLAELLDLVEVQAASHIGMLHPGPEAILDALAGGYVRTPVGQGGHLDGHLAPWRRYALKAAWQANALHNLATDTIGRGFQKDDRLQTLDILVSTDYL